jgi:transcriptional regulator with XRE-family HTH domain
MTVAIAAPIRTGGRSLGWDVRLTPRTTATYIRYDFVADPFFERVLARFDEVFAPNSLESTGAISSYEPPLGAASAVAVILELVAKLGLSQREILSAAGIRKRTFMDWQKNPSRQPRLASQADLWALAQSFEVIAECLGGDLQRWLKADPERIKLLRRGAHRDLARLATRAETEDPDLSAMERRMGVGFFDEGETPERDRRETSASPMRVSAAVRGHQTPRR